MVTEYSDMWLSAAVCVRLCPVRSQLRKLPMPACCNSNPAELRRALSLLHTEWLVQSGFIWGGSQQKTRVPRRWVAPTGLFAVHVLASLDTGSKQTLTARRGLYWRCGRSSNARRTSEDLAENICRSNPRSAGKDILCEALHERDAQTRTLRLYNLWVINCFTHMGFPGSPEVTERVHISFLCFSIWHPTVGLSPAALHDWLTALG